MNINTGREFDFKNPQDDKHLYPELPEGFRYNLDGTLSAILKKGMQDNETLKFALKDTPIDINHAIIHNELKPEVKNVANEKDKPTASSHVGTPIPTDK